MEHNFKQALDKLTNAYTAIFGSITNDDTQETILARIEYADKLKNQFMEDFANAGVPYIPEDVAEWFNHPKTTKQRNLGLGVREIFADIDQNEYELFTNLDLSDWNSVVNWIDENEEDFIYLWLNETYKVLAKETYYLYNPFENGYMSEKGGITHHPKTNGKKYSISDISDIDPKLMEWAVRIDEV